MERATGGGSVHTLRLALWVGLIALWLDFGACISPASASTIGSIVGHIVSAANGAAVAGAQVTAASPSDTQTARTDATGFFSMVGLYPDTYTLTVSASGFESAQRLGVTVLQDQTTTVDMALAVSVKVIGRIAVTTAAATLVQPNQPADVYVISGTQLAAATGGDHVHKTLYEYMQALPGVTANGYPGQPRVRGGNVTDLAYEWDGIPIADRIVGFFTTNLSNVGVGSVELYTGGYGAQYGDAAEGVLNSVIKAGTYPPSGFVSVAATSPDYNHYLMSEYGWASPNHKFSYMLAFDGVNSQNDYNFGKEVYPRIVTGGFDGPGPVWTRDWVLNTHVRPNEKNDFQFIAQNGLGVFDFNYLLGGVTTLRKAVPCPGPLTTGGVPCPHGLEFAALQSGEGNTWFHYSGIGKVQWNHTVNDHTFFSVKLSENFNQYIFQQPISDPNWFDAPSKRVGMPARYGTTLDVQDFYGDRSSRMYLLHFDFATQPNENHKYIFGVGEEYDKNLLAYYFLCCNGDAFDVNGFWPNNYLLTTAPIHMPDAYVGASYTWNKLLLQPSLRWDQISYGLPARGGGPLRMSALQPRLAGTFSLDPDNVLRGSWGSTTNFIGSAYIFNESPDGPDGGGNTSNRDPTLPGTSIQPELQHNADFMWEHQFHNGTSLRVGPWWHKTTNYFGFFKPIIGTNPDGTPILGKTRPYSGGKNRALGADFALAHDMRGRDGLSWFVSLTYDNYWSSSPNIGTFVNGLPSYASQTMVYADFLKGVEWRNPSNPLWSGSVSMDYHWSHWDLLSFYYWQTLTPYNVYSGVQFGKAYGKINLTLEREISTQFPITVGVRVSNLFNVLTDTAPCKLDKPDGCYPFNSSASFPARTNFTGTVGTFQYQPYASQNPRRWEFFMTQRL